MKEEAFKGKLRTARLLGTKIVFEVREDEVDGGYSASAIGFGIHTQGETIEEIRENVREAFECYFDGELARPEVIHPHFAHGEVLVL